MYSKHCKADLIHTLAYLIHATNSYIRPSPPPPQKALWDPPLPLNPIYRKSKLVFHPSQMNFIGITLPLIRFLIFLTGLPVIVLNYLPYCLNGGSILVGLVGVDVVEGVRRSRIPIGACEIYGDCEIQLCPTMKNTDNTCKISKIGWWSATSIV